MVRSQVIKSIFVDKENIGKGLGRLFITSSGSHFLNED